jgi:ABC-type polysaccharide/polyol phosphate transport system ATPase subunit
VIDSRNAIEIRNVSKTFRLPHHQRNSVKEYLTHPLKRTTFEVQQALDDVSLSVERGEFFGIIGANGGGKSTLLKIIARIYPQDSGTVEVSGLLSPFIELGVGFNPELSARDNIRINSALLGLTRRELNERFDSIIEFSELDRFIDQKLKNFSSGMQIRLAYSIAIQVDFDILLLDEVLAVGDERFQEKCFATFADIRAAGKTVVFVSHDLDSVSRFCDRTLYVRGGRPQLLGETSKVVDFYRQTEVDVPGPVAAALR